MTCSLYQLVVNEINNHLPHVFWCPTGQLTFLPLHAAGIYGSHAPQQAIGIFSKIFNVKLFTRVFKAICFLPHYTAGIYGPSDPCLATNMLELAVSSYTPTLTALLNPIIQQQELQVHEPRVVIVSQEHTPGQHRLPGTIKEAEFIQKKILNKNCIHLEGRQATVSAVLKEISTSQWVHLACHGIQNAMDPLKSSFVLHDGTLDLENLIKAPVNHAQLAFLSACQTATGNVKLPEEAVHLTAGMLATGFSSVVGTMWSICDEDAPILTQSFYSKLVGKGIYSEKKNGQLQVAYALHDAVKELRKKVGEKNFERWVPFVHFGL